MTRSAVLPPRSAGMLLIELLVVIAIIGVLVALLLPAIQQGREAARRAECLNNLRQIGISMQAYHGFCGTFPSGCIERRGVSNRNGRQIAWGALILPYVEQQAVFDMLDLNTAFDSARNAAGAAVVLPVYICPSVDRTVQTPTTGRAPSDYGGIYGPRFAPDTNNPPQGMLIYDTPITLADVLDGTSNTLMVSEDSIYLPVGEWISGMTVFDVSYPINTAPSLDNDIHGQHPHGANGMFVDGSAKFLADSMTTSVLSAICTRATSDPASSF